MRKLAVGAYKVWNFTSSIASVFLVANMLVIVANIVMRRFFNAPIFGSTEIVCYVSLITASLALAQNEWFDGNIRMTLLLELIPEKAARIIHFIGYIGCSFAFLYISYLLIDQARNKFVTADISTDLKLPVAAFATVLAVGFIILTVCMIVKTIILGYGVTTGDEIDLRQPSGTEEIPLEDE